jgi:two-component system, LuxR family, sensor kinase FixL
MGWVTITWSMVASACLTLAAIHFLVWCKKRTAWPNLLFSLVAASTTAFAGCELWMMQAETPGEFGTALRWVHVPVFALIVGLIGFVQTYLGAGRWWLAWTTCAVRAFSLLLNFLMEPNVNYREITRVWHIPFLGDSVSVCEGVPSPWNLVGHLSLLLLAFFVTDAGITVWRRSNRRQAVVVAGSIVFFVLAATVQTILTRWEVVHWPETACLFFLGIVLAMGYEMSREVYQAAQLSDELRESKERMTLAAEAAGVGVWMWDLDRNKVWGSERWLRLFGFAPDAAVNFEDVIKRIHPDDRKMVESEVQRAVMNSADYAGEYRVILPDDTPRWIAARGRMHSEAKGKPGRMLGAATDITHRRESEAALKESEKRFHQVAEIVGEFIWEVDVKGLYTYASPSVEQILGYTTEELVGKKHFYDLFEPSVREGLKAAAFQVFAAREAFRYFPNPNVSKSGEIVHLETSGSAVLDRAGNLIGYRGADADVTRRKQSENEIEQQRTQLAHLSRVNMLGELAGSLAHEINQPLTAILSNAQAAQRFLAHDQGDLNEIRDILADIVAEDKRAGEVIRRLRGLLKKGEVQHQPLNMNEVVEEVLKLVRNDLVNQSVIARTELAPDLPLLYGDNVQIQQVLINLVMNAGDAMVDVASHERRLTIRTNLAGDGSVHLSVADCGKGVAPEELERIFEPFYTTKSHGLGFGLAICRTIITAHGGTLWATNNPERGATFHFALPVSGTGPGKRDGGLVVQ